MPEHTRFRIILPPSSPSTAHWVRNQYRALQEYQAVLEETNAAGDLDYHTLYATAAATHTARALASGGTVLHPDLAAAAKAWCPVDGGALPLPGFMLHEDPGGIALQDELGTGDPVRVADFLQVYLRTHALEFYPRNVLGFEYAVFDHRSGGGGACVIRPDGVTWTTTADWLVEAALGGGSSETLTLGTAAVTRGTGLATYPAQPATRSRPR